MPDNHEVLFVEVSITIQLRGRCSVQGTVVLDGKLHTFDMDLDEEVIDRIRQALEGSIKTHFAL